MPQGRYTLADLATDPPRGRYTVDDLMPDAPPPMAPMASHVRDDLRPDGTRKGRGYFGPLSRPDGRVSTELSVGVNLGGREVDIPAIVPTLTKAEVDTLLALSDADPIPDSIIDKAVAHAEQRRAAGRSPFADETDVVTAPVSPLVSRPTVTPDARVDAIRPMASHEPAPRRSGSEMVQDAPVQAARSVAAGLPRFNQMFWGGLAATGDALGLPGLSAWATAAGKQAGDLSETVRGPMDGMGERERAFYSGFESMGAMAPGLVLGVASGQPSVPLALMGGSTGGESYLRARDANVPPGQALLYAATDAATEVLTEKIPVGRLLGDVAQRSGLLRSALNQLAAEIPGEQVATVVQDLNEWATLNPEKPFSAYLTERPNAAANTLIATITGTLAQTAGAHMMERAVGQPGQAATPTQQGQFTVEDLAPDAPPEAQLAPSGTKLDPSSTTNAPPTPEPQAAEPSFDDDLAAVRSGQFAVDDLADEQPDRGVQSPAVEPFEARAFRGERPSATRLPGKFFSPARELASEYGDVREVTLRFERPLRAKNWVAAKADLGLPMAASMEDLIVAAQGAGYDGIVFENHNGRQEYVAIAAESVTPVDTPAQPAQTTADAPPAEAPVARVPADPGVEAALPPGRPASGGVGPSRAPAGEGVRAREARRAAHVGELYRSVLADARALDPDVNPREVRAELDYRLSRYDEQQAEARESGTHPRTLLEAIARHGGLGPDPTQGGLDGEQRWLRESAGRFGEAGGVQGVFRATRERGSAGGRTRSGLTLDEMLEALQQDPAFQRFDSTNDLIDAIDAAIREGAEYDGTFPGTEALQSVGVRADRAWWQDPQRPGAYEAAQPKPFSAQTYREAFGGTQEQADALEAVVDAMGLPKDRLFVAKGGRPGDLTQEDLPSREELRALRERILATPSPAVRTTAWMRGSPRQVREAAINRLGQGRTVENRETRRAIVVSGRGIEQSLQHGLGPQKVAALAALDDLIANATFVTSEDRIAGHPGMAVETYASRVSVDGQPFVARLVVRKSGDRRFYDHELSSLEPTGDGRKEGSSVPPGQAPPMRDAGNAIRPSPTSLGKRVLEAALSVKEDGPSTLLQAQPNGPRASIEFTEAGEAILRALRSPNVSSGLHEMAHAARRFLFDRSIPAELREGVSDDDIRMAEAWAGATDGEWTRAAEEKFARGFERYMRDGQSPNARLKAIFEKFARWLAKVYQRIDGSPIDVEISPAMRGVFDRLVTRTERLQQAEAQGDASFDVDAFEADLRALRATSEDELYQDDPRQADLLDTGEVQPRLPGAESVRDEEIATPREEAPFSLTREVSTAKKGNQGTLFQDDDAKTVARAEIRQIAKKRGLPVAQIERLATGRGYTIRESPTHPPLPADTPVPVDEYFNFARVDLSPGEATALRQTIEDVVRQSGRLPKERVTFDEIRKEAAALHPAAVEYLAPFQEAQGDYRAVRLAMRQRINTLNREVITEGQRIAALPEEQRLDAERRLRETESDLRQHLDTWMKMRSEDGRNLAMHRMLADSTWQAGRGFDHTYWLSQAKRTLGLPQGVDLPLDVYTRLNDLLAKGDALARDGGDPTAVQRELADLFKTLSRSGWLETIATLRKAGLLTGIKTHLRNIGGNAAFQALEEISRLPGAAVDVALSVATGRRTVQGISPTAVGHASYAAATDGIRDAKRILKGQAPLQADKAETARELNSGIQWLDLYANTQFRLLGAEDRVFKSYAFRRSLEEQAALRAVHEGRSPVEILAQPSEAMIAQAIADAEFATFNNENKANRLWQGAKNAARRSGDHDAAFLMDTIVPFVRTPTNILGRVIDYSPLGVAGKVGRVTVQALAQRGLTEPQQRAFARGLGRGLTGSALMWLGWELAAKGLLTGADDDEKPGQRNVASAAGRSAGALRLPDGKWHSIGAFSPVGNLLVIGATMQRQATRSLPASATELGTMAGVVSRVMLDQPVLTGAQDAIQAMSGRGAEGRISATVGSFVPTIVSDVASLFDPYRRDARPDGFTESLLNGVQSRLPGLRNYLPARETVFGEPVAQSKQAFWDPTLSTAAKELGDRALGELIRHDVGVNWPTQVAGVETDAQFRARQRRTGQVIKTQIDRVVTSPAYQRASPERQTDMLEDAIQAGRRRVRPPRARQAS